MGKLLKLGKDVDNTDIRNTSRDKCIAVIAPFSSPKMIFRVYMLRFFFSSFTWLVVWLVTFQNKQFVLLLVINNLSLLAQIRIFHHSILLFTITVDKMKLRNNFFSKFFFLKITKQHTASLISTLNKLFYTKNACFYLELYKH